MSAHPDITPVDWWRASEVLGHEERGFSAWLSENLWLLEEALGLDGLGLVDREVRVESFRADLVLAADDGTDDGLPIVVENQYGKTNHDHLGKLITYLAAWQRGLGVWVVEEATDAHVAAVDFLNRSGNGDTGYALLVVRFAPAPEGRYYVDAEALARPNAWIQPAAQTSPRRGTPERAAFLEAVHEQTQEPLTAAGWAWTRRSTAKPHIRLRLPSGHPLERSYGDLRASPQEFTFRFNVVAGSLQASVRAVELLKERYGDRFEAALPEGTEVRWHTGADRANAANDRITVVHPDGGYGDLDPNEAAEWAVSVCGTWIQLLTEDPPHGLLDQARHTAGDHDEIEPGLPAE